MNIQIQVLAAAVLVAGFSTAAQAQENTFKVGAIRYTTNSKTNGIQGAGVPPGADAETGDATTLLLTYERALTPNIGVELVIGLPPKITARATGTVAFLGDDVLSAKNVAPTLLVNYHFGARGDAWRPYAGAGINYTKFVSVKSKLAPDVEMSDSTGLAVQLGIDYTPSKDWGLFASIAKVQTKSKLVAAGSTVLTTEIDFRPTTYSFGVSYRF
jgi:outer membrane protein